MDLTWSSDSSNKSEAQKSSYNLQYMLLHQGFSGKVSSKQSYNSCILYHAVKQEVVKEYKKQGQKSKRISSLWISGLLKKVGKRRKLASQRTKFNTDIISYLKILYVYMGINPNEHIGIYF